jgi:hypothetical protein
MLEEQPIKKKGRPAKRQPQKQQDVLPDIPPEEEGSLYHMVLQGKASLPVSSLSRFFLTYSLMIFLSARALQWHIIR